MLCLQGVEAEEIGVDSQRFTVCFVFQAVEAEEMGIDSDDTRPIVTVDQSALSLQWKRKTARIKRAMIIVGIVTAIIAFGLATYCVVHLLTSS